MTNTDSKMLQRRLLAVVFPLAALLVIFFMSLLTGTQEGLRPVRFLPVQQSAYGGALSLQGSFDRDIAPGERLWLYAENAMVEISVSGETHRFNTGADTPSMFRSPGSGWYSFAPPALRLGEPVSVTVRSYYAENDRAAEALLSRIYTGDGGGLFQMLLEQIGFLEIVLICVAIAGMIYFVEGGIDVVFGMEAGARIALFGLYFLTGALWSVTDVLYPYLSLLIAPLWMAALVDMSGLLLFPIALALMMRYYIRGKRMRSVMNGVLTAEVATATICLLLQLTGVLDVVQLQPLVGGVALISLGAAMACTGWELYAFRNRHFLFLFLSVLPVFMAEILDGINVIWPFMARRALMRYSFTVSALLMIFQLVIYANAERTKEEALRRLETELADSRISTMLSQIQPHFLYNALQGIKRLCDVDHRQASEALEHFSYYLRGNLDSLSDVRLIPFEKELDHLEDYLYLEKMRFSSKLRIELEVAYQDFLLPPLTVQPIVENAIRHGINKKQGGGTLWVRCQRLEECVLITIADDGVGFDIEEPTDDGRLHVGIENTRKRLETLCGGSLLIQSETGVGTTVKIMLPQGERRI